MTMLSATRAPATRWLGTAAMIASAMFLLQGLLLGFDDHSGHAAGALLNLAFLAGWACSAVGLRLLRATGPGGGALLGVQLAGLAFAGSQDVQDLLYGYAAWESALYRAADLAWPASVLFMLVVGGLTLRAGVWRGWRRYTPLLCGLALPLGIAAGAAAGPTALRVVTSSLFAFAWLGLGYAVRTGERGLAAAAAAAAMAPAPIASRSWPEVRA
jgi:hypothetical protein